METRLPAPRASDAAGEDRAAAAEIDWPRPKIGVECALSVSISELCRSVALEYEFAGVTCTADRRRFEDA
jgi:hypothetical protein